MQEDIGTYDGLFPVMNNVKLKPKKMMENSDINEDISLLNSGYKPIVPQPGSKGKERDVIHIQSSPVIPEEKVSHMM